MTLLLDTATFLWIVTGSSRLSARARALYEDPDSDALLSVVSAWEIATKHGLGRLDLPDVPSRYVAAQRVAHGIESLPLDEEAVFALERMPAHHRDPFDRMLACQALTRGLTILTPDEDLRRYPIRSDW